MADGNGYATAPDIAHLLGITTTLVYVWAHRDHWHRTRTRPRRYRLTDAHQSWDKRHPQHAALPSLTRRPDLHVRSGSSRSQDYASRGLHHVRRTHLMRCWTCTVLGCWTHGPTYWLLRFHLRRVLTGVPA